MSFRRSDSASGLPPIRLACLDMAGTTVFDDGLVEKAFTTAVSEVGIVEGSPEHGRALQHVRATMGESKIVVFRAMLGGDDDRARLANSAFERAYGEIVAGGGVSAVPGAEKAMVALREAGISVCLTTGFSRPTQDALLQALGWTDLVDLALVPSDAGRGRPFPDMILTAVLRLGVDDVRAVAVAGDTSSDVLSGVRSGASVVAGVLTGAHDRCRLEAAGATHVLDSIADLPGVLVDESAGY